MCVWEWLFLRLSKDAGFDYDGEPADVCVGEGGMGGGTGSQGRSVGGRGVRIVRKEWTCIDMISEEMFCFVVLCYYSDLPELYIGFYFYLFSVDLFNRLLMYSDLE